MTSSKHYRDWLQDPGSFEILNLERIDRGGLLAKFDLSMPGLVVYGCRFVAAAGREPFVAGPSSKDAYAYRGWRIHAEFQEQLAANILAAVRKQLDTAGVSADGNPWN
jgi:hypothetical protein